MTDAYYIIQRQQINQVLKFITSPQFNEYKSLNKFERFEALKKHFKNLDLVRADAATFEMITDYQTPEYLDDVQLVLELNMLKINKKSQEELRNHMFNSLKERKIRNAQKQEESTFNLEKDTIET